MAYTRAERILMRNDYIRSRFYEYASKKCFKIDYILNILSKETGLHAEYIRSIVKGVNITEKRLKKELYGEVK